jgi:hypothetical protein
MTDEPWDEAPAPTTDYTTADDLGEGKDDRLCIIYPKSVGSRKSKDGSGFYDYVETIVLPIDGPTSEKVPAVGLAAATNPLEMQFQGTVTAKALKAQIQRNKQAGKIRPILCRLDWVPSPQNKRNKVWGFGGTVTAADKALARKVLDAYEAQEVDPFAAA